jgi:hypothetical protein
VKDTAIITFGEETDYDTLLAVLRRLEGWTVRIGDHEGDLFAFETTGDSPDRDEGDADIVVLQDEENGLVHRVELSSITEVVIL